MKRGSAAASAVWSGLLFWSRFGINSVVFVVISRWLPLEEIGAYGVAFALVQIIMALQTSGLPEAVIQLEADEEAADNAFWLSALFGLLCSALIFFTAPLIGLIYESARATEFARLLALVPLFTGLGAVSEGIIRSRLNLRALALRTALALGAAGALAVWLAYEGHGGWALAALATANAVLTALMNVLLGGWRPRFRFSRTTSRKVGVLGAQIALRNLLKSLSSPMSQMIVSLVAGTAAGGVFLIALRIAAIMSSLSLMPAQFVALPIFAKKKERREAAFVEATGVASLISSPLYMGVAATAPLVLTLIVGSNGTAAAPVTVGMLFHSPVLLLFNLAVPLLTVTGHARATLQIFAWQTAINLPLMIAAAHISVTAAGWSFALLYYALLPLLMRMLYSAAAVRPIAVLGAAFRPWFAALVMAGLCTLVLYLLPASFDALPRLAIVIGVGVLTYIPLVCVLARPEARAGLGVLLALYRERFPQR